MEQVIVTAPLGPETARPRGILDDDEEAERQRRELQRLQRERTADERLEELKRKFRS
jgi:hypothetical protein